MDLDTESLGGAQILAWEALIDPGHLPFGLNLLRADARQGETHFDQLLWGDFLAKLDIDAMQAEVHRTGLVTFTGDSEADRNLTRDTPLAPIDVIQVAMTDIKKLLAAERFLQVGIAAAGLDIV